MNCPCGSSKEYAKCCEPFITGKSLPETAEQLMRSRYTAYTNETINYIKDTLAPESQKDFNITSARKWAKGSEWLGLKIISSSGGAADNKGTVEFIASYKQDGHKFDHHETSEFRKNEKGQWLFVDGESNTNEEGQDPQQKPQTIIRETPKIGRNDPCTCGSGKKYKKCCGVNA